jgi:hypothetical protein
MEGGGGGALSQRAHLRAHGLAVLHPQKERMQLAELHVQLRHLPPCRCWPATRVGGAR